jgi:hypothetical protein
MLATACLATKARLLMSSHRSHYTDVETGHAHVFLFSLSSQAALHRCRNRPCPYPVETEFHQIPWIHEIPWNSINLSFVKFSGIPWKILWNSMKFHWISWIYMEFSMEFHGKFHEFTERFSPGMFFYDTQMPPESLPMSNLSWNLSTFQARQLGQRLRAKWGGQNEVLYKLLHCTPFLHCFCTCRSPASTMSPIGMHFTQAKSLTSRSSPNTPIFRIVSPCLSLVFFDTLAWHSRTLV